MKTIYLNADFRCHVSGDETMQSVETEFFDGKCDTLVEGYRLVPDGQSWMRDDGVVFTGEMISPWKPYNELAAAQREYERQQLAEANAIIAELDAALLDTTYNYLLMEE